MKRKYMLLRSKLRAMYLTTADVAKEIGKSKCYVDTRFAGTKEWELDDAYKILAMIDVPAVELPIYFPRNGDGECKLTVSQLSDTETALVTAYNSEPEMQKAVNVLLRIERNELKFERMVKYGKV